MISKEDNWDSFDGFHLFIRSWVPDTPPKAAIILIHGLGEHSGRYEQWAKRMVQLGVAFYAPDMRGHGQTKGIRGHVKNYSFFLRDIANIQQRVHTIHPEVPIVLYGHSLGGNICLNYAINGCNNFSGLIISSPWLKLSQRPHSLELLFVKIFSHITPKWRFSNRITVHSLTRDDAMVKDILSDKLFHRKISLGLLTQAYEHGLFALRSIYKINKPMLLMHGDADLVTQEKASKEFVQNSGSFTQYVSFQGGYHELHSDTLRDEVFETVKNWLNKNVLSTD